MVATLDPLLDSPENELELCCGGKRCPKITQKDGVFTLSDEGQAIELSCEQAKLLGEWLRSRV